MSEAFPLRPDDAWYRDLVDRFGEAVPPRERIRLHDNQLPALDSMLRVVHEMGIDQEVRVTGIFARAGGETRIDIEFTDIVDPTSLDALCHKITFWTFEVRFSEIAKGEFDD